MVHLFLSWTGLKERNVLFNDALNTFCLQLYVIEHIVKDHSDSEKGNLLPPHGILFPISKEGCFYMHYLTDRIAHGVAAAGFLSHYLVVLMSDGL